MLPRSNVIASVTIAVALAIAVLGGYAYFRTVETSAQTAALVLGVLADEQETRWRQQTGLLVADLNTRRASQPGSPSASARDGRGAANTLAWRELYTQPIAQAQRHFRELAYAGVLDDGGNIIAGPDGGPAADSSSVSDSDGTNRASTAEAASDSDIAAHLIESWRAESAAASTVVAVPVPAQARLYFVAAIGVRGAPSPTTGAQRSSDEPRHYLITGYNTAPLNAIRADLEHHRRTESKTSLLLLLLIGIGVELVAIILIVALARRSGHHAERRTAAMAPSASGSIPAHPLPQQVSNRLPGAGLALNDMAGELAVLLQETAEKSRMDRDLEVVHTVQTTLLPAQGEVERGALSIAGELRSAGICGGDWWTYRDLADGKLLLAIGDVTGHGASAAMITAAAKAACDLACDHHENRPSADAVLSMMNQAVYYAGGRRLLMTCLAMVIDPESGDLELANAGHNFPWLVRMVDGQPTMISLVARGNRLGDAADSSFDTAHHRLQAGDRILLYTDGILECANPHGVQYGVRRMREAIIDTAGQAPGKQKDALVASALAFSGGNIEDDLTLVTVGYGT